MTRLLEHQRLHRGTSRRWRRFLVVPAACAAIAAAALAQDHHAAFRNGIKALDEERWSAAAGYFVQAIALEPKSSKENINIYGMRYERYLPHFYLGLAREKQGDCRSAIAAWSEEHRQGVIRGGQRSELQKLVRGCGGTLQRPTPPRLPRTPPTSVHRVPPSTPTRTRPAPPSPPTTSPSPAPKRPTRTRPSPPPPPSTGTPPRQASPPPSPPPPAQPPPSTTRQAPPTTVAGDTATVRREVLEKRANATRACLGEARRWIEKLETARDARRWKPSQAETERLDEARKTLAGARFRLDQGSSEGDLEAVEKAYAEACGARANLADLGRGVDLGGG